MSNIDVLAEVKTTVVSMHKETYERNLKEFEKASLKAIKYGVDMSFSTREYMDNSTKCGIPRFYYPMVELTITCAMPEGLTRGLGMVDEGWKFVGGISRKEGGLVMYKSDPEDFAYITSAVTLESAWVCDHCGTKRKRNSLNFFKKDGEYKQIASGCSIEWFGFDPMKLLGLSALIEDIRSMGGDEEGGGGWGKNYIDSLMRLSLIIRFFKESPSYMKGIGAETLAFLGDIESDNDKCVARAKEHYLYHHYVKMGEENNTEAEYEAARVLLSELALKYRDAVATNEFEFNVKSACMGLNMRHLGLVAYGLFGLMRDKGMTKSIEVKKEVVVNSEFFGVVGEKFEEEVVVTNAVKGESDWGVYTKYTMVTNNGSRLVYISTGRETYEGTLKVKGTIKKHNSWMGRNGLVKETMVTRCKKVA